MNNKLQYATISDIHTTELLFYNKKKKEELVEFCKKNGITYLPAEDRQSVYRFARDNFISQELTPDLIIEPNALLFSNKTLNIFENGDPSEVRFVCIDKKILGVIHIADYNKLFLYLEFYQLIYSFESMLRELLVVNGFSNTDLIDWMEIRGKKDPFWEKRYLLHCPEDKKKLIKAEDKRESLPPFQTFLLSELIDGAIGLDVLPDSLNKQRQSLLDIRNWVAHSKAVTSRIEDEANNVLYDFNSLKKFVRDANNVFLAFETLKTLLLKNKNHDQRSNRSN